MENFGYIVDREIIFSNGNDCWLVETFLLKLFILKLYLRMILIAQDEKVSLQVVNLSEF